MSKALKRKVSKAWPKYAVNIESHAHFRFLVDFQEDEIADCRTNVKNNKYVVRQQKFLRARLSGYDAVCDVVGERCVVEQEIVPGYGNNCLNHYSFQSIWCGMGHHPRM